MIKQESSYQKESDEETTLNYQSKKLLHMIELQILDIESTLHYIQKKHTMHQLKQALSQIYNIFNQTEPLFKLIKGIFLHQEMKKIMNCFGIIYVILMGHIDNRSKDRESDKVEPENVAQQSREYKQEGLKFIKSSMNFQNDQQKVKARPLGGIYLYNQQYTRHMQGEQHFRKGRQTKQNTTIKDPTRQELRSMVSQELNDNSHLNTHPDDNLDVFSFKFKYGKDNQVVTFHDELLSIANFFKQSQNEAFQFLNKTKDQTSIITYNDSFKDVMNQIKKEKQEKLRIFTNKIKSAFGSIKSKTELKVAEIENKLIVMEETQHIKQENRISRETQTIFNIDEQIKSLKRRLIDSEEKYRITMQIKKKQLQENTMLGLQLQNQIGLKNREIVYLKLNIEQKGMQILNLNKRVKFLTDSNRKIKDIVRNSQQIKVIDEVQNKDKQYADKLKQQEAADQVVLEQLRKQRKMAKKILLEKRNSISLPEKAIFVKRFTQQLDTARVSPKNMLSRNLSQINEGSGSEFNDDDGNSSMTSNKNQLLGQQRSRPNSRRKGKKISIVPDSRGDQSSHSIKSRHSFTNQPKKALKEKQHVSQILDLPNRTSFLAKLHATPPSINEDSMLDECSEDEQEYINRNRPEKSTANSEEYKQVEEMFRKQMGRTKNLINNKQRLSLNPINKNTNKSHFSSQRQAVQQNVPNLTVNKVFSKSKFSVKNQHEEEQNKIIPNPTQKTEENEQIEDIKASSLPQLKPEVNNNNPIPIIENNIEAKALKLTIHSSQFSLFIQPIEKSSQIVQTQAKKMAEFDEQIISTEIKQSTFANPVNLPKAKENILPHENSATTQLLTRSPAQSKISKSRHLKTLYSVTNKEKYFYPFSKNTEKSVDDIKNSQSQFDIIQELPKELQKWDEDRKETIQEQQQRLRQERQMRKLAIKCKTLQEFKARVTQMHKQKCGHNCKHLQKFVQNYIKYKQESKLKMKLPIKNLSDNINYTVIQQEEKNYFPVLQKKKN